MGRGGPSARKRRPTRAAVVAVVPSGQRVRIVTEGKTAVVLDGYGPQIIVEMDDGSGPRRIPRWDIATISS